MDLEKIIADRNQEAVLNNKHKEDLEKERLRQARENAKINREMIQPLLDLFDKKGVNYEKERPTEAFEISRIPVIDKEPDAVIYRKQNTVNLAIKVDCLKDKPFSYELYNAHYSGNEENIKSFTNLTDMVSSIAHNINSSRSRNKGSKYYPGFDKLFV